MLKGRAVAALVAAILFAALGALALGDGLTRQAAVPQSDSPRGIIVAADGSQADCSDLAPEDRLRLDLTRDYHETSRIVGTDVTLEQAAGLVGYQPTRPSYLPHAFVSERSVVTGPETLLVFYSDGPIAFRTPSPDESGHPRLIFYQTPVGDTYSEATLEEYVAKHSYMTSVRINGAPGYGYPPRIQALSATCGIYHEGRVVWVEGTMEFGLLGYFPLDTLLAIADSVPS